MSRTIGLWVDHKEAVLVSIKDGTVSVRRVESEVGTRFNPSGGWKSGGTTVAQSIVKEQTEDERRKHHLHAYYQELSKAVGTAEELFIFGPGEAKHELVKKIEKNKGLRVRIAAVETCDKMTEPQIAAKVKAFFKS
jgi:stalled ribosome rescue protein Dom34